MAIVARNQKILVPPEVEGETIFEMVPVEHMFHDLAYSRGVSERQVEKMGGMFDQQACGVLYVSYREPNRYAVLDGCHRHSAAVAAGIESLPCRVYIDLTVEDEANLFTRFNRDRRPMKVGEVFHARLTAHDPRALEIQRIVQACGMDLAFDGGGQPGKIHAIASIENIYKAHGPSGLRETLLLARDAWGVKETRAYTQTVLSGLVAFWVRYRDQVNRSRFIDRLRLTGPTQLLAKSNAFRTISSGIAPDQAFGRTLLSTYNYGLPERSRLLDWPMRVYGDVAKAGLPEVRRAAAISRKAKPKKAAA